MSDHDRAKLLRKPWSRADAIREKRRREERAEIVRKFREGIRKEKSEREISEILG